MPASAILVVEGLDDGLFQPVGLGYVAPLRRQLHAPLRHDQLLLLERVGFRHRLVTVHPSILADNMRPSCGEGAVVIVDPPTWAVDGEGGR